MGLVPYTGIMPIEISVDHTGPMTRTIADNALLLEVLAGPDAYDPPDKILPSKDIAHSSIPLHLAGVAIWVPIGVEGLTQTMMWGDGYGVADRTCT